MKMYFMGEEAWAIISGVDKRPTPTSNPDNSEDVKKWDKAATTFLSTIYFACTQDVRVKIQHCETAPDAWKILREEFERDIPSMCLALHTEFQSVVHDTSESVSVYTNHILDLADQLGALNRRPSDKVISGTMLAHLDPSFSEIVTTLSSVNKVAAPKDIAAKLDAWERKKVTALSREKAAAAASTTNGRLSAGYASATRKSKLNSWGNRSRVPCSRCGIRGHFEQDCDGPMLEIIREELRAEQEGRRPQSHAARRNTDSDSDSDFSSDTATSRSRSRSPPPRRNDSSSKASSSNRQKAGYATIRALRVL